MNCDLVPIIKIRKTTKERLATADTIMNPTMQAHYPLDGLTTFGTQAKADYFAEASTLDELEGLLAKATANDWPVHFLGAGANTIAMSHVKGLVIKIAFKGYEVAAAPNGDVLVKCGAGEVFDDIVRRTLQAGLGGLENLSAIPGTVGGAVVQNIGAYGVELAERLASITVYDRAQKVVRVLSVEECDFRYRHSIMKTEAGQSLVVLSATLRLPSVWTAVTGYKDLEMELEARGLTPSTVTASELSEIVRTVRARKLPDPKVLGNAGSFFTNPIISKVHWHELLTDHPSLVYYRLGGGRMKLAAAWLIEAAGYKGYVSGTVGVYEHHALILVNRGGATGEAVLALAEEIIQAVKKRFGVTLTMEPVTLV